MKRNNERFYPLVCFVLIPIAGVSSAYEFHLFKGNLTIGLITGLFIGTIFYVFYKKYKSKKR